MLTAPPCRNAQSTHLQVESSIVAHDQPEAKHKGRRDKQGFE